MQYLVLVYNEEAKVRSEEMKRVHSETGKQMIRAAQEAGVLVSVARLEPTAQARTARLNAGSVAFTDGPFAETKEQLAGFFLLDCSEAEVREWAARFVRTGCPAAVEIRPVMWAGEPDEEVVALEAATV